MKKVETKDLESQDLFRKTLLFLLRKEYGARSRLAENLKISKSTISDFLNAQKSLSEKNRIKIAKYYGYKYEEFLALGRKKFEIDTVQDEDLSFQPLCDALKQYTERFGKDMFQHFGLLTRTSAGVIEQIAKGNVEAATPEIWRVLYEADPQYIPPCPFAEIPIENEPEKQEFIHPKESILNQTIKKYPFLKDMIDFAIKAFNEDWTSKSLLKILKNSIETEYLILEEREKNKPGM